MSTVVSRQYLCNQCGHILTSAPHPNTSALICPNCTGTSLEPFQNPNPTDNSIDSDQLGLSDGISGADGFWSPPVLLVDYIGMFLAGFDYGIDRNESTPASRVFVEALSIVTMSEEMVRSGVSMCAICRESFCVGDVTKVLPCKHVYHCDCILPWLGISNSCPLCRFKLPTDEDEDYENMMREASFGEGSNSTDGNSGHGNGNGNATSSNEDID